MKKFIAECLAWFKGHRKAGIASVAALAVLVLILCSGGGGAVEAECETVVPGNIEETIPANGRIQPVVEVKVSPEVSGEIVELNFKEGDHVEKGDLILKIRQDLYLSQLAQAEASLGNLRAQRQQQKAEAGQAETDHLRNERLYDQGAISKAEFEKSKADLEMLQSGISAANYAVRSGEAQFAAARENLLKTTVYAPMSGTVSRMNVEIGEIVVGTSQMAGTELLRIADLSRMEAVVDVSENDVVRIAPGDRAIIEIDAYPHRKFEGFVTQIANSAKNIDLSFNQVANFEVRIEIRPDEARIYPGMSASVSVVTLFKENCLTVPLQSVRSSGQEEFVWVAGRNGSAEKRTVRTGVQNLARIEILEGLEQGETVVTGPLPAITEEITEGVRLKVANR